VLTVQNYRQSEGNKYCVQTFEGLSGGSLTGVWYRASGANYSTWSTWAQLAFDNGTSIKSASKTATTDANGFWKATVSGATMFVGAIYTGTGEEPFVSLVSTMVTRNEISIKLTNWRGEAIANTSITLTVYYI
jgi:hypothetical protein